MPIIALRYVPPPLGASMNVGAGEDDQEAPPGEPGLNTLGEFPDEDAFREIAQPGETYGIYESKGNAPDSDLFPRTLEFVRYVKPSATKAKDATISLRETKAP